MTSGNEAYLHDAESSDRELSLDLFDPDGPIVEEIKEVISIHQEVSSCNRTSAAAASDGKTLVDISRVVEDQLRDYVTTMLRTCAAECMVLATMRRALLVPPRL